jgi:small subunit ribosomal protein S11
MTKKRKLRRQKKEKKNIVEGIAHIKTTFNNTIITISDMIGNVICWSSAGICEFSGRRKSSGYAAQMAAKNIVSKASKFGLKKIDVVFKGRGYGREPALRTFYNSGLKILAVEERSSFPHNGCRSPKRRRL